MIQLGEHFKSDDQSRHTEWLRRRQWFIKARRDNARQEAIADKLEDEVLSLAAEATMATEILIEEFKFKLDTYDEAIDTYDEAIVISLMENQDRLDEISRRLSEVEMRIQDMLNRAYVMEDGRRVFLTEDQTQAFDESRTEVTSDEFDFGLVPKSNPTWETVMKARSEKDTLLEDYKAANMERENILEFQEKVDAARERVADGEISKDELDDLDAELSEATPASVKKQVPGFSATDSAPAVKAAFVANANPAGVVSSATPEQVPAFDPMG